MNEKKEANHNDMTCCLWSFHMPANADLDLELMYMDRQTARDFGQSL